MPKQPRRRSREQAFSWFPPGCEERETGATPSVGNARNLDAFPGTCAKYLFYLMNIHSALFHAPPAACNCGSFCLSARWSGMQRAVLIALILVLTASSADARRRHHRVHFYMRHAPVMMVPPAAAAEFAREPRGRIEAAQIVPRDWQLQPPDPNWQGRR